MNNMSPWLPNHRRRFLQGGLAAGAGFFAGVDARRAQANPTTAGAALPVHIVNTTGNTSLVFGTLMRRMKFLEQAGVTPSFLAISDGAKAMGALLSGTSDICIGSGFSQVLPAIEAGGRVRIVAGGALLAQVAVYSSRPEIRSVRDLKGRTIGSGAPGSLLYQLMVALLRKKNMSPDQVRFVSIGSNSDVFRAISAGIVDAGPGDFDYYDQQAKFGVHSLRDGNLWTELPEYTGQASFASVDAIEQRREALVRTLVAYAKLYHFIQSTDSHVVFEEAFSAGLGRPDPRAARTRWQFYQNHKPLAERLLISEERVRYMQELNLSLGLQKRILPFHQVVDNSLAEEALKRL